MTFCICFIQKAKTSDSLWLKKNVLVRKCDRKIEFSSARKMVHVCALVQAAEPV